MHTLVFGPDEIGPVDANGDYDSSDFTPANTGDFFWTADYSGDANNAAVSTACGDDGETSTVSPATPAIARPRPLRHRGRCDPRHRHISGLVNPIDGTVTFNAYSDDQCTPWCSGPRPPPVDANGDYDSSDFTPANTGDFFWTADYSGDANNAAVSTACGDDGETSTVSPATPAITTTATNATVGDAIHDTAHISGLVNPIDGTVTFNAYSDDQCTPWCSGPTRSARSTPTATTTRATSPRPTPATSSGTAALRGRQQAAVSTACGDDGETSTVSPATPAITTTATNATVGGDPRHRPHQRPGQPDRWDGHVQRLQRRPVHTLVFGPDEIGPVDANGDYDSSDFTPANTGDFFWTADYSGDANNAAVSTACGDDGETSTVSPATPAITTTATAEVNLGSPIHDTATISGLVGADGTGTITFNAYSDAGCTNLAFGPDWSGP